MQLQRRYRRLHRQPQESPDQPAAVVTPDVAILVDRWAASICSGQHLLLLRQSYICEATLTPNIPSVDIPAAVQIIPVGRVRLDSACLLCVRVVLRRVRRRGEVVLHVACMSCSGVTRSLQGGIYLAWLWLGGVRLLAAGMQQVVTGQRVVRREKTRVGQVERNLIEPVPRAAIVGGRGSPWVAPDAV